MWTSFVSDLLVAVFASLLTVAVAYGTYVLKVRHDETLALQSLIDELHERRALAPNHGQVVPHASGLPDFEWANRSVSAIKGEIRRVRDQVRQVPELRKPLKRMTQSCNRYLEMSAAAPENYAVLLGTLRIELFDEIHNLHSVNKRLRVLQPGTDAYKSAL